MMATVQVENAAPTSARDRVVDAVGRAAHVAHEARVLKTLASDAIEDGTHAAKRMVTRSARNIEDWRDAAAYRVKKAPLMSVAVAAAVGLLLGVTFASCGRRASQAIRSE